MQVPLFQILQVNVSSIFKLVCQSCGLGLHEVTQFLEVKPNTAKSWWLGRRNPPESAIEKLLDLSIRQDIAAQEVLLNMGILDSQDKDRITLNVCGSDSHAQAIGWPSASAYRAIIRRVVEKMPPALAMRLILITCENVGANRDA